MLQKSAHLQQEKEVFNTPFIQSFKGQQNTEHYDNLVAICTCCVEYGRLLLKH